MALVATSRADPGPTISVTSLDVLGISAGSTDFDLAVHDVEHALLLDTFAAACTTVTVTRSPCPSPRDRNRVRSWWVPDRSDVPSILHVAAAVSELNQRVGAELGARIR